MKVKTYLCPLYATVLFPADAQLPQLSLPYREEVLDWFYFEVVGQFDVEIQDIQAWFDQPGGGEKYTTTEPLRDLVKKGLLTPLDYSLSERTKENAIDGEFAFLTDDSAGDNAFALAESEGKFAVCFAQYGVPLPIEICPDQQTAEARLNIYVREAAETYKHLATAKNPSAAFKEIFSSAH